jgi:hypothetical protein
MDPIDVRADTTFTQALRCVEYRLPKAEGYRPPGYVFALGLRYGMIGMAASHHLLITSEDCEERDVLDMIGCWPEAVENHVRMDLYNRLPFTPGSNVPHLIAKIASLPLQAYLPLYRRLCPLSRALELVGEAMVTENRGMIYEGWSFLRRKAAMRSFESTLRDTDEYALHFFERRQADLEEVPEIVLIGE